MRTRVVGVLLVVGLFALAIARLRRAERPRFDATGSYASGRIVVGTVRLARRDAPGRVIGWSVTCGGREVFGRLGLQGFETVRDDPGALTLRDRRTSEIVRIDAARCTVGVTPNRAASAEHPSG